MRQTNRELLKGGRVINSTKKKRVFLGYFDLHV